jgi:hypothetical protein
MPIHTIDEDFEVIVDFPVASGRKQVALKPEQLVEKSRRALDRSMDTIHAMAKRVRSSVSSLDLDEVEVEFGITFDVEAGAFLAKAGMEANINVRLKWTPGKE